MLITKLLLLVSSLYLTVTASTAKNAKASSGLLSSDLIRAMTLYVNDDDINNGVSCSLFWHFCSSSRPQTTSLSRWVKKCAMS